MQLRNIFCDEHYYKNLKLQASAPLHPIQDILHLKNVEEIMACVYEGG